MHKRGEPSFTQDLVTRRTIGSGSAENGLYFLDQPDQLAHSSTTSPTTQDDLWQWHRRLGASQREHKMVVQEIMALPPLP
ncbi:hypothetical protein ACSBR2_039821 [Camellia fascicularis]